MFLYNIEDVNATTFLGGGWWVGLNVHCFGATYTHLGEDHAGTLHDQHTSISTSGRPIFTIFKVRLFDDIELVGGSNYELQDLTHRLVDRATA